MTTFLLALLLLGDPSAALTDDERGRVLTHSPLPPPPLDETNAVAADPRAARLGHMLFYDPRLSGNGRLSCASCHVPHHGFADTRPLSEGVARSTRNVPSLWNVAYNRWFFWDGRADSLWAQATQPIESLREMAGDRLQALRLVAGDSALRDAYRAVFGDLPAQVEATPDPAALARAFANVGKALAAFEHRIVSRRAPFDVFVEGLRLGDPAKRAALTPPAVRGLKLFVGKGNCAVCHVGPLFTDGEFHDLGLPLAGTDVGPDPGRHDGVEALRRDEFSAVGAHSDDRDGPRARRTRFVAARPETRGQIRTPGLRNVALTAPYMHQGQLATLDDVVEYYSTLAGRRGAPAERERILEPLRLTPAEKADLVTFLRSLTDDSIDPALLAPPAAGEWPIR